ncbi:MAG: sigma-54 dependent transcriptional regulator [Pseudomonadales bacterium]|nr:sigma-54 dependent transcriptional regulator [Pseudomonadales bacterium]
MKQHSILIIDDDELVLKSFQRLFRGQEYGISCFSDPVEAMIQCVARSFDLILCDQRMPGMLGTEFFKQISQLYPKSRRILISGYSDFNDVTDAFNEGIIHKFVVKPWSNNKLRALVAEQLALLDAGQESVSAGVAATPKTQIREDGFHGILTQDAAMQAQLRIIEKTASSDAPFFIHGETGTGKEMIARAIHAESDRADNAFVALNCANLTETLLESQLFGHRKGAFTGAEKDQKGLLSEADGGTLFLDEVTEIPLALQAKLLRVLQEREYTPLGETKPIKFDVKLVSASSLSLEKAVDDGRFREDLRYRLEVMPINLPPLRSRGNDVVMLFEAFTAQQLQKHGREPLPIAEEVYRCIRHYDWPGNIRELVNVCTYIAALADENDTEIHKLLLPPVIQRVDQAARMTMPEPSPADEAAALTRQNAPAVEENVPSRLITKEELQAAIDKYQGHRDSIARHFGISRMTLWRKMKHFDLT